MWKNSRLAPLVTTLKTLFQFTLGIPQVFNNHFFWCVDLMMMSPGCTCLGRARMCSTSNATSSELRLLPAAFISETTLRATSAPKASSNIYWRTPIFSKYQCIIFPFLFLPQFPQILVRFDKSWWSASSPHLSLPTCKVIISLINWNSTLTSLKSFTDLLPKAFTQGCDCKLCGRVEMGHTTGRNTVTSHTVDQNNLKQATFFHLERKGLW